MTGKKKIINQELLERVVRFEKLGPEKSGVAPMEALQILDELGGFNTNPDDTAAQLNRAASMLIEQFDLDDKQSVILRLAIELVSMATMNRTSKVLMKAMNDLNDLVSKEGA